MSNVVPLSSTCEYLVARAASHRRAGRYDEAMALLTRAKETHGASEDVEFELAQVYESMECEEEAARCYLRVVRHGGRYLSQALFQLSLSCAQRADLPRAVSYYERFCATDRSGIQEEYANLLGKQLKEHAERPAPSTRKQRARALEQRASNRLQEGKAAAAERTMKHALHLRETAQGYTLLACCQLVLGKADEAVRHAKKAHGMAAGRIQTLCILADAYACAGKKKQARKTVLLASLRAKETDDLFSVAIEAAKHGMDDLVLQLTQRVLKRDPFHTKVMMIRAAALVRSGRMQEANKLYARLCGLTPENTICEAYFKMTRGDCAIEIPPPLGLDVTPGEADRRLDLLIAAMYEDEKDIEADAARLRMLCRLCSWALRSLYSGQHGALMAVVLMSGLNAPQAAEVLLDALMDPQITDSLKMAMLQIMTSRNGIQPYDVDLGGRLVRLAAGANAQGAPRTKTGQSVVQTAADRLMRQFPDAPSVMLPMWVAYLDVFGAPKKQEMEACSAALEMLYHEYAGHQADTKRIAGRCGVSLRALRYYAGRIRKAAQIRDERIGSRGNQEDQKP